MHGKSSALPSALVGIGASAGGLEAIADLLIHLPTDTGMAFLVVQHLQADHPSMLVPILATKTSMAVSEATEGASLEGNQIYVIPPNTVMRVSEHRIQLGPRSDALGPPMPVDDLLESLAHDQGPKAIGVILSGSGSDGALGMQKIKAAGGLTFAQDEASARFDGMPSAAIGLGCVDRVLPPGGIAEELARIGRHPYLRPSSPSQPAPTEEVEDLKPLLALLRTVSGVNFTHYKTGTLRRRIARRLALHNLATLSEYLPVLENDSAEAQALCQDLLIQVTSFFRDPESFTQLTRVVFPRLLESPPRNTPLRVWVPGCASGEELYSIGMCLLEFLGERAGSMQIKLFGTDISEAALRIARDGTYVENIAREVSEERLQRFFVKLKGSYRVSKLLRDLCVFAKHDITRDPPFSRIDLLSCRNLLIYFDPVLQKRVIPLFHYALNPEGVLMLGSAESIGPHNELFTALDAPNKIYARKATAGRAHVQILDSHPAPQLPERVLPSTGGLAERTERAELLREVERIVVARFAPASVLCDEALDIVEFLGDTEPYLAHPRGPSGLNLRQLVRPELLTQLSVAIQQARDTAQPVRRTDARIERDGEVRQVDLDVIPIKSATIGEGYFLICFEEVGRFTPASPRGLSAWWTRLRIALRGDGADRSRTPQDGDAHAELAYLRRELAVTRELISSINDAHEVAQSELKATQEELLSSNEEFRSTTEELQTAKEELQSSNEELATTNDELRHRNVELSELNTRISESRDYAEAVVRTIREPLLVLDRTFRIVQANPAYYATFNTLPALTEQGSLFEVGHGQWDIAELRARVHRIVSEEVSFEDLELTGQFGETREKTLRFNGRRLAWSDHILILLAIEDVTERAAALDALKQQELRKDEFLAMLAHELRNPLAPMLSVLEVWRRGFPDAASEKQGQAVVHRQLQQQIRLVNDLLDVSRINSGRIELQTALVDLSRIVSQSVEDLRGMFDEGQRHVSLTLPAEALWVHGDATRLAQVVTNLLGNAVKYSHSGGRILVTVASEGPTALLKIADNGMGIAPELMPTIFDLFVQEKRSLDRSQGGLGLGLTLVRRIVELHGGTVEAHSAGVNQGSAFIVRLPASPAPEVHLPVAQAGTSIPTSIAPLRALVVDDNIDSAESIAMLLRLYGHEVKTSSNGPAGLKLAATFQPQVVVLDIGLPGMDGYEVARQLRELPQTKHALLIALSGYGRPEDRERAQRSGFDHHLVKPADVDHLVALIAAHGGPRNRPVGDEEATATRSS